MIERNKKTDYEIAYENALEDGKRNNYQYLVAEHVLLEFSKLQSFQTVYNALGGNLSMLQSNLKLYLKKESIFKTFPDLKDPYQTKQLKTCNEYCYKKEQSLQTMFFLSSFSTKNNFGLFFIKKSGIDLNTLIYEMNKYYEINESAEILEHKSKSLPIPGLNLKTNNSFEFENKNQLFSPDSEKKSNPIPISFLPFRFNEEEKINWKKFVNCVNDEIKDDSYFPIIGREAEVEKMIQNLSRKNKNNPVIIGNPGVGKSSLVYLLAEKLNKNIVPEKLKGKNIYSLSMTDILAGSEMRGSVEARIKLIMEGIIKENAILFIDEIHTIMGSSDSNSIGNILKPYLLKNDLKLIGATTADEYARNIEKDTALDRRFVPIYISEPSIEDTKYILSKLQPHYENFHNVIYTKEAMDSIIELSCKYIRDKFLPDKAIDILDMAGAQVENHIGDYPEHKVTKEVIQKIISELCKIPNEDICNSEYKKLLRLPEELKKRIVGQNEAIEKIKDALYISKAGLVEDNKPIASLLFTGPTGVGKTEMTESLSSLFQMNLIKLDMSEYKNEISISKIIGAAPGYVGYTDGTTLIDTIRKNPYSILLLDEIEKAHSSVFDVFLQAMDKAVLTNSHGKHADLRNVVIIMTSNIGAADIKKNPMGLTNGNLDEENKSIIEKAIKNTFSAEFINRLDTIVHFNYIDEEKAKEIIKIQLNYLSENLISKKITINYDESAINEILKQGYSKEYGARNIKRVINEKIKPIIAKEILFGNLKQNKKCVLFYEKESNFYLK